MSYIPSQPDLLDRFCQYLCIADSGLCWRTDSSLKRNFILYQFHHAEFADLCQTGEENAIAIFWREIALSDLSPCQLWEPPERSKLALRHLSAFLEKDCYQTAKKFFNERKSRYSQREFKIGAIEDYWQNSRAVIQNPQRLITYLKRYDLERGSVKTYFLAYVFKSILQDFADGGEARFSKWRLLYKASKRQLKAALGKRETQKSRIDCILFAWENFKTIYNQRQLSIKEKGKTYPEPTSETYEETVAVYNYKKLYNNPRSAVANSPNITVEKLREWLELCIKALSIDGNRNTLNSSDSLDRSISTRTDDCSSSAALIDDRASEEDTLTSEEEEEEQEYKAKIENILNDTFPSVEAEVELKIASGKFQRAYKSLPLMYYGFDIKLIPLERYYGVKQSNLTRHLEKYYKRPLTDSLDTKATAKKQYVDDWIAQWFGKHSSKSPIPEPLEKTLKKATKSLTKEEYQLWELRSRKKDSLQCIARQLLTSVEDITEKLQLIEAKLEKKVLDEIKKTYEKYIEPYLKTIYRCRIETFLREAFQRQQELKASTSSRQREPQVAVCSFSELQMTLAEFMAMMEVRDALLKWIEETVYLPLDRSSEHSEIEEFIQKWLTENQ